MIERLLARIPLFESLPRREIKRLAGALPRIEVPAGMVLFHEGDPGDCFYIILEGELEIIKGLNTAAERLLNVQKTGEYIGELSFLTPHSLRTASVRARTDACMLEMTGDVFQRLLQRWPSIAWEIARKLMQRLLASEEKSAREIYEKEERVVETLSEFQASLMPFLDPAKIHKATAEPGESMPVVDRFRKILLEQSQSAAAGRERKGANGAVGRSARPRLHIRTFGRFEVFRGATAIGAAEWGGKQPQLLLKALISREGRSVPKDVLIEDLWPEVDTASGDRNFKVTLHRLRKALEPAADRTEGSSYIHLRNHMVSLDGSLCHVDVDEFVSWCRNGRRSEGDRKFKEALSAYEKAVSVYEGDYLAEDLYAPWAAGRRDRMRSEFLEVLYRMGALYEMAGSHKAAAECYARILRIDAASEQACQRLMIVYSNRGMRSAALKVYEDCKKALRDEIGVVPDTLTDSIYRKILEQE